MDPVESVGSALVAVGAGAEFHHGVELKGRVALGFASLVAEGSCVEESVVLQEAWIGPGCHLRRTIVAPGVEVPAGFRADQAVLCPDPGSPALRPPDAEVVGGLMVTRLADQATARV
jgi:ADP-glucose pyrophosphorylase